MYMHGLLNTNVNDVVNHLGIDYYSQGNNKLDVLNKFIKHTGCKMSEVAYIGDDVNDIETVESDDEDDLHTSVDVVAAAIAT